MASGRRAAGKGMPRNGEDRVMRNYRRIPSFLLSIQSVFYSIRFYSILIFFLFSFILFYSILLYSILFYSILCYSILFYSIFSILTLPNIRLFTSNSPCVAHNITHSIRSMAIKPRKTHDPTRKPIIQ
jgi:hypothetical protein